MLLRASARDVIVWKEFYFDSLEFLCSVYERLSVKLCEDIIVIESYREWGRILFRSFSIFWNFFRIFVTEV